MNIDTLHVSNKLQLFALCVLYYKLRFFAYRAVCELNLDSMDPYLNEARKADVMEPATHAD